MTHSVFSIVAPVAPANVERLKTYLDRQGCGRQTPIPGLPFDDLDVHFASFVVFPPPVIAVPSDDPDDSAGRRRTRRPCHADVAGTLVFENCVDGPIDVYLDALMRVGAKKLLSIFSHCVDFKPDGADEMAYLRGYLGEHVRRPHLHHIGNPRVSTAQIAAGASLRSALDSELDDAVSRRRSLDQPQLIIERLRSLFNVPPSAHDHWHLDPESPAHGVYAWFSDPAFPWPSRLWHWSRALALGLGSLALVLWAFWAISARAGARGLLIALGVLLLAAWIVWRWLTGGQQKPPTLDPKHLHELTEREDRGVRNHMASLALLKPGLLRRVVLRLVFFTNNLFYRTVFTDLTPGRLFGLPTIHFAQWTIVPVFASNGKPTKKEALLFLSNYDSSWETYLDDFLAYLIYGVIAFWANTDGFPRPLDGRIFKQWARTRMTPWQYWHQHRCYGDLTVLNILNNDSIRKGLLRGPETDHAARLWLARFGAIKEGNESFEETQQLEEAEIQGLVLSGYKHLEDAMYVFLRIAEDSPQATDAARQWLGKLLPRITDARERPTQERAADTVAVNLAVTWRGLRALGLDDSVLNRFPLAFKEGVAPGTLEGILPEKLEHRSRILGDTGDSAPEWWKWGGSEKRVDLLVMVFGKKEKVARHADWLIRTFEDSGAGSLVARQDAQFLHGPGADPKATFEHFGFRDGLSDPIIEGSWRARRYDTSVHLMKPGEFLLGYPSADGTVTPGIPVETCLDRQSLLPPIPRTAVALGDIQGNDFGRNGTYLVCRQLAQDVAGFRRFVGRAAGSTHRDPGAEAVGARIVGRWRDGTPIGVDPRDPTHPSNEFGFASDPYGFGCPIGAHVRRANPRDSLGADPIAGLQSANRHRLLRRGRPYGPPLPEYRRDNDGEERGLLFICLNSDIERQFEFVQQNWINNPAFGGLYSETDPLVGGHGDASYLTVQANAVRHRFTGFSQFVKVRGGEYLLPAQPQRLALSGHRRCVIARAWSKRGGGPPLQTSPRASSSESDSSARGPGRARHDFAVAAHRLGGASAAAADRGAAPAAVHPAPLAGHRDDVVSRRRLARDLRRRARGVPRGVCLDGHAADRSPLRGASRPGAAALARPGTMDSGPGVPGARRARRAGVHSADRVGSRCGGRPRDVLVPRGEPLARRFRRLRRGNHVHADRHEHPGVQARLEARAVLSTEPAGETSGATRRPLEQTSMDRAPRVGGHPLGRRCSAGGNGRRLHRLPQKACPAGTRVRTCARLGGVHPVHRRLLPPAS